MAAPLALLATARNAAQGAALFGGGGRRPLRCLLAIAAGIVLVPALLITAIIGGAQPDCGPTAADKDIPGSWDGPGSLGGVLGTGVSTDELQRARQHSPHGGTNITAGPYRSTAYAPSAGGVNCDVGGSCANTASGIRVDRGQRRAYLIASNPRLNKYGALAYIWPNPFGWKGPFVVADTGGDFQGVGRLDFYVFEPGGYAKALTWGNTKMVKVSRKPIVAGGPEPEATPAPSTSDPGAEPASTSAKMLRPTPGPITSRYGMRWGRLHAGIDFGDASGTPIRAVLDGVVVVKAVYSGYGNYTCIRHRQNLTTCYGHQSRWANIRQGAPVKRGQVIGYVGNTGRSTGPHLHFEVRLGPGFSGKPVDPAPYIDGAPLLTNPEDTAGPGSDQCAATEPTSQTATGDTPLGAGEYAWPAGAAGQQGRGKLIGFPGMGTHSFSAPPNNWQSDNALDIALPVGTPLVAVEDGVISNRLGFGTLTGDASSRFAGLRFHLADKRGNTWYYAHLSRVSVRPGQRVKRGQVVGYSGSANGVAHLHLGVERGNPQTLLGVKK